MESFTQIKIMDAPMYLFNSFSEECCSFSLVQIRCARRHEDKRDHCCLMLTQRAAQFWNHYNGKTKKYYIKTVSNWII